MGGSQMVSKGDRYRRHLQPFHWREAALCVPAMPLMILCGVLSGYPTRGVIAAGAAFAVGFGAARELGGRRWGAMLLAMAGMSVAAVTGTLLGQDSIAFVGIAAALAAACAALALHDEDMWWAFLQVVIILFVAGYYPGNVHAAFVRGAMTLTGGAAQIVIVVLLARIFPRAGMVTIPPVRPARGGRALLIAHMARAAAAVAACLLLIAPLGLANGYWAPLTALIVLKPRLSETRARGIARVGGTIGGCALATLFAAACRDTTPLLLLGVTMAAGAAFALQKAHYASLTASITATIVLLTSLGQASAVGNAEHRIAATLLVGALALLAAILVPHQLPRARNREDRVG